MWAASLRPTTAIAEAEGAIRFRLILVGTAKPPFVVETSGAVQLGEMTTSLAAAEVRLVTREVSGSPPWIGSASSTVPELRVTGGVQEERASAGGILDRVYAFKVAPASPLKIGEVSGEVRFLASGPDEGVVQTLPIRGSVPPRIDARPSRLDARPTPDSAPPRLHFSVMAADPDAELNVEPLEWPRDANRGPERRIDPIHERSGHPADRRPIDLAPAHPPALTSSSGTSPDEPPPVGAEGF